MILCHWVGRYDYKEKLYKEKLCCIPHVTRAYRWRTQLTQVLSGAGLITEMEKVRVGRQGMCILMGSMSSQQVGCLKRAHKRMCPVKQHHIEDGAEKRHRDDLAHCCLALLMCAQTINFTDLYTLLLSWRVTAQITVW